MRQVSSTLLAASIAALAFGGCDMGQFTVNTTAKVLVRAQPSLQEESDFELANRAIPGTLKTIEGFWLVSPNNKQLIGLLTEGFCQYGIGFVEDEWEEALAHKDYETAQYHSTRATKMYVRCLNYALKTLGKKWQDGLFGDTDSVMKLIDGAKSSQRTAIMWAAIALGAAINQNKDNVELIAQLPTAKAMLEKVVEFDDKHPPKDPAMQANPHIALGLLYTATGAELGGDAKKAQDHFARALAITKDRYLLARVHLAKRVGVMLQDRKMFRDELLKVLQTDPAIWPEQRLANEIAQRKARRYLRMEKELF